MKEIVLNHMKQRIKNFKNLIANFVAYSVPFRTP